MARERSSKLRAAGQRDRSDRPLVTAKGVTAETERANLSAADDSRLDDERRRAEIALAAYYRAERRGFGGNGELDDWLQAEREIDNRMADTSLLQRSALLPGAGDAAHDRDLIETHRLAAWAKKLKVSTPRLREAIERVGPSVSVVKQYLESSASTPPSA